MLHSRCRAARVAVWHRCHHGWDDDIKVVTTLARAFLELGFACASSAARQSDGAKAGQTGCDCAANFIAAIACR
jgi:hypothetical protein